MAIFHHDMLNINIANATRHNTAERNGSMSTVHVTVLNNNILRWTKLNIRSLTRIDSNTIIARIELGLFDQYTIARLRIKAIIIRPDAVGINLLHIDITAIDRIVLPEGTVRDLVSLK